MHGLGNDFVVIDSLSQDFVLNADTIRSIANRRTGIGCDQLLLIEAPQQPDIDFNYRIFNADGGEVEQCGNGARCLGKYIKDKRLSGKSHLRVSTCNSLLDIHIIDHNTVSVDMGAPVLAPAEIPFTADVQAPTYQLEHEQGASTISAVSMGNPHAVMVVDNVDTAPVMSLGAIIEKHPRFPAKVNVGFMQIVDRNTIKLRVFERGVGETQACGSGACAAVVAGRIQSLLDDDVSVHLLGGELNIKWPGENQTLVMTGTATKVFDGKIRI